MSSIRIIGNLVTRHKNVYTFSVTTSTKMVKQGFTGFMQSLSPSHMEQPESSASIKVEFSTRIK